jgi:hypothetical protein
MKQNWKKLPAPHPENNSPVRLRGHHLICLHFYNGEGYDAAFIDNLSSVISAAKQTWVIIVEGADNVCSHCPSLRDNICRHSEQADEEIREMDATALGLLCLSTGSTADWRMIRERLPSIFPRWHEKYCTSCEWKQACAGKRNQ